MIYTSGLNRRAMLSGLAGVGLLALMAPKAIASMSARIVIIGGGFGGATAARNLRSLLPSADITLIEQNASYVACPFSNLVIAGQRSLSRQTFTYGSLSASGVNLVIDRAADVDPEKQVIRLEQSGQSIPYDKLILSPGIDLRWGALEGYDQEAVERMPHAWKAGAQTDLLRRQLEAMKDGGTVAISVPAAPYRCPPGPYERASLIAHYLQTRKPASKLIILDSKDNFSKKPLFLKTWAERYSDVLEWRSAEQDGRVTYVDPDTLTLSTDFEDIKVDVANVIPPQKAGAIADRAGVADATGWCPIDAVTFGSMLQQNIHVIGDAAIAAPMPKSAFAANAHAKICAIQIARNLAGLDPAPTTLANTCYSFISPNAAISVAGVYRNQGHVFQDVEGAGGLSLAEAPETVREFEAQQARDWYAAITQEAFG